jgi:hypothetical protein
MRVQENPQFTRSFSGVNLTGLIPHSSSISSMNKLGTIPVLLY